MTRPSPLGQTVTYVEQYDPTLLYPIARTLGRAAIGLGGDAELALPFIGVDVWTAHELSWLDAEGKPQIGMATFTLPCMSPSLIESKSLKLYLNSFNQTEMPNAEAVRTQIVADLSTAAGAPVDVQWAARDTGATLSWPNMAHDGVCIDGIAIDHLPRTYQGPCAELLCTQTAPRASSMVHETLITHLLKSNCPVTGQPDWATLRISYRGMPIDHAGLLAYVISYRQHHGFHEQCVEHIFMDVWSRCAPCELSVYARYTRRGGLDINPYRASPGSAPLPPPGRSARQ